MSTKTTTPKAITPGDLPAPPTDHLLIPPDLPGLPDALQAAARDCDEAHRLIDETGRDLQAAKAALTTALQADMRAARDNPADPPPPAEPAARAAIAEAERRYQGARDARHLAGRRLESAVAAAAPEWAPLQSERAKLAAAQVQTKLDELIDVLFVLEYERAIAHALAELAAGRSWLLHLPRHDRVAQRYERAYGHQIEQRGRLGIVPREEPALVGALRVFATPPEELPTAAGYGSASW